MLEGISNVNEYSQKWNYLTYGMAHKLFFLDSHYDTIYPLHYTFQNPHIYNNSISMLYVFSKKELLTHINTDLKMGFKDELFSRKEIRFEIPDFESISKENYNLKITN
jgi:hypothetical protein